MIGLIYCFIPIFLLLYQLWVMKKRTSITWNIKKGEICYHCKESLNLSDDLLFKRLLDPTDYSQLCISCNRDKKIQQIKRPYLKWKFKFLNFIISKDFNKFNLIFVISIFSIIILDVILISIGTKIRLWPVYGTINLIFYLISIYRTFYTTTKKPSE